MNGVHFSFNIKIFQKKKKKKKKKYFKKNVCINSLWNWIINISKHFGTLDNLRFDHQGYICTKNKYSQKTNLHKKQINTKNKLTLEHSKALLIPYWSIKTHSVLYNSKNKKQSEKI